MSEVAVNVNGMTAPSAPTEQLALLKRAVRQKRPKPVVVPAATSPVAKVAVDVPLAHLDRPFDYTVLESMTDQAVPGSRVKVRFAGRDVDGFVLERAERSDHGGTLAALRRVVSPEPVLTAEVAALARAVADRYAGTLSDVLRLAVPPRHARVEAEAPSAAAAQLDVPLDQLAQLWAADSGGAALVRRLARGDSPRAVWTAKPTDDWPHRLAVAAAAARTSGRGSIVCLPDARDVARIGAALTALLGAGSHVVLTADLGPAARYRAFLAALRDQTSIVIGTRAAAFAPVSRLGLVAMWDDGDDLFAEPRAPYPHAREVLMLRAHLEGTAVILGSYARSVASQLLVESRWAVPVAASRQRVRESTAQVQVAGDDDREIERDAAAGVARMPRRVFEVVRAGLTTGPVLVQSPRYGYQPALACASCRAPARCLSCAGPLDRHGPARPAVCRWCQASCADWTCRSCGSAAFRTPVVGSLRTAQEWGLSFPRVSIVTSGGDTVVDSLESDPVIVIATPGAEPRPPPPGYAAAVLLDTWLAVSRPDVRASEEALRRWMNAAALVRTAADGGRVLAVGEPSMPALQALVRWDPDGFASRELADRTAARLPPAARVATLTAPPTVVSEALEQLELPSAAEVLGPVEASSDLARFVVRMPRERGRQLARALQQLQAARSARKLPAVRVQIDPDELG
jgi:primosomal protein N' (replication factor Y) (superfamily II helicase)